MFTNSKFLRNVTLYSFLDVCTINFSVFIILERRHAKLKSPQKVDQEVSSQEDGEGSESDNNMHPTLPVDREVLVKEDGDGSQSDNNDHCWSQSSRKSSMKTMTASCAGGTVIDV